MAASALPAVQRGERWATRYKMTSDRLILMGWSSGRHVEGDTAVYFLDLSVLTLFFQSAR